MGALPGEIKKAVKAAVILALCTFLFLNPLNLSFITAIGSQEIITYHIRDILDYLDRDDTGGNAAYYLATGNYEEELDGPLFGAAKDRNLIVVQVESLQNMVLGAEYEGQEITPELNALIKEPGTIYFDNYYQQVGSGNTSDAEFASNNSLLGSIESYTYQLFENHYFKGLPWILKEEGYSTAVFHGYKKDFWNRENFYPVMGFDTYYGDTEFVNDNRQGIGGGNIVGISDHAFFRQSVEYMKELPEPFYSFLITLSSHNPFGLPSALRELTILPEDDTIFGNYLNSVHYADKCIGEFLDRLKEEDLYDNSILVFYGDHFGLTKSDSRIEAEVSDWLGYEYTYDNMLNIPLLIHIPGEVENKTVSISGGQIDLMPTLCYLLGIEELDTLYLGQNLLTAESGLAPIQTHMLKGSFIKDEVVFEMSRDGVFENGRAWNRYTREEIDPAPYLDDYVRAAELVELNRFYLYNDVLRLALLQNRTMEEIRKELEGEERLPDQLDLVYVRAEDEAGLAQLVEAMEAGDDSVLLASDDLLLLLERFQKAYSGVTESRVGAIKSIDQAVNESFLSIKNRIIPLLSGTENYTKLEYLGYSNSMVLLSLPDYTPGQLAEFLENNEPCAVALEFGDLQEQYNGLLRSGTPVFLIGGTDSQKAAAKLMGAYGFIK